MKSLGNKVAIVTGADRGIGQGIAVAMASAGARVVVNYPGPGAPPDETLRRIADAGGVSVAVEADITCSRIDAA